MLKRMSKRMKDIAVNVANDKVYTKLMDAKIAVELMGVGSKENNKTKEVKKESKGLTDKLSDRLVKTHEKMMKKVNEEKENTVQEVLGERTYEEANDVIESTRKIISESSERIAKNHEELMKVVNEQIEKNILDERVEEESDVIESTCRVIDEALNGEDAKVEEPKKEEKSIDEVVDELIKPNGVLDQIEENIKEIVEEPKEKTKEALEEGDIDYIVSLARMIEDEELENEVASEILKHKPAKEEEIEEMFDDNREEEIEIVNMDEAIKLHFQKQEENK